MVQQYVSSSRGYQRWAQLLTRDAPDESFLQTGVYCVHIYSFWYAFALFWLFTYDSDRLIVVIVLCRCVSFKSCNLELLGFCVVWLLQRKKMEFRLFPFSGILVKRLTCLMTTRDRVELMMSMYEGVCVRVLLDFVFTVHGV